MKLYLIDGSGYLYREFYGVRPLSTSDGTPTNAVYGVAKKLLSLIKKENPDHICVCFDAHGPTFRKEMYTEYKANRPPVPSDLLAQFPLVRDLIRAMGVPQWEKCGYEADDLLGTLAANGVAAGYEVIVYSGDKDLAQLVGPGVSLRDPYNADRQLLPGELIEKMGVYPNQVVDYLAMMGDSADNIPGVPKVGAKTAAKLLGEYGTLENILANVDNLKPPSVQKSFMENRQLAEISKELATIKRDVPEPPALDDLRFSGLAGGLYAFLQSLEMRDLAAKVGKPAPVGPDLFSAAEETGPLFSDGLSSGYSFPAAGGQVPAPAAVNVTIVTDESGLAALSQKLAVADRVAVEAALTDGGYKSRLVGLGLQIADDFYYLPLAHRYLGAREHLPVTVVLSALRPYLENRPVIYGHDLKTLDVALLQEGGWQIQRPSGDTMVAAYLLDPERESLDLSVLGNSLGLDCPNRETLLGKGKKQRQMDDLDEEAVCAYLQARLAVIVALNDDLAPKLSKGELLPLYRDLELPLIAVLAGMESAGVRVDATVLNAFGKNLSTQIGTILSQVTEVVGADYQLNISSPQQLSHYLYDVLGLKAVDSMGKALKGTDQEALEALVGIHPLPQLVLDYRQLSKLQSTYVEALLKVLDKEGRVHTYFNQVRTATGRLSSSDPNLQNIPSRTALGRNIRQAFTARDGYCLLAADYSQIELRMLAHFSKDPAFIAAYKNDEDIHERTARELFGTADGELRRQAKTINFGIIYGLSSFSLAKSLGITNGAAKQYMEDYFGRYPGIREFMARTLDEAKANGYVTTIFGRRRYLPALNSGNGNMRHQAERMAVNTVIQGSAADLIKVAMLRLDKALREGGYRSRLLLQVHDELIVEVSNDERLEVLDETVRAMEEAIKLLVPLKVEAHFGQDWAAAH